MKFRYGARTKEGELQVGYVEAVTKESAADILSGHGLYILSLEHISPPRWYSSFFGLLGRVKRKDVAIFTRQFATMLEAKISIHDSLAALYYQTPNQALRETIFEISADIDAGLSLSQTLEKRSDVFREFYVNLVQAAEVTGRVEEAMTYLADFTERELLLLSKIKSAMIYPVFVVVLAIVVGSILIGLVFPQVASIFVDADVALPFVTRAFLWLGFFINDWWIGIVIFLIIFGAILFDYLRTKEGKAVLDEILVNMPFMGKFFQKLYVARFAEVASVLVKGGIPIAQAIEIAGHTVGSAIYREVLHEVAEGVRRGDLLSQGFARYPRFFPPIVEQMVTVGEQTGKIDEVFVRIGNFYNREVESLVGNLVELVQPILMVLIGTVVGFMFAAILFPIYNLIQVIK